MLAKLIKYDLKYIFKRLSIYLIVFLISNIIFNITSYTPEYITEIQNEEIVLVDEILPPTIVQFLHTVSHLALSCFLVILIAMTFRIIWQRFKTNFYNDEAYLTHTLPIARNTLWLGKTLSSIITFVGIIIFFIINCLILCLSQNGLELLQGLNLVGGCTGCVGDYYFVEPFAFSYYCSLALATLSQFVFMTLCGFTGIVIGQRANRAKNLKSLLCGFGIYLLSGILAVKVINLLNLINPSLQILFQSGSYDPAIQDSITTITQIFFVATTTYICYIILLYILNRHLLKNGINLE